MPFKSEAQRKFMYANHPEMAREFEAHTPKGTKLPERVKKKGKKMTRKKEALELGAQEALEAFGVKAAAVDLWNPTTGAVIGGMGASANRNVAVQGPTSGQMPAAKPQFDLNALRAAYQKAGVKPGLTSAVRGKVASDGVLEAMAAFGVKAANLLSGAANVLGKGIQHAGAVAGEVPVIGQAAGAVAGGIGGAISGAAMAPPGQRLKQMGIGAASGAVEGGVGGISGMAAGAAANAGLNKMLA